ncbi:mannan endo-1,4-beta-mannosidase 6-like isoform X3 [Syzygium oleosum]|uniref:mannan endo-1,4-beta-mannosidase 6-like isoform X3 n=1 Tax=Syzygium oleosum TaxID=219896 RepID=UPI0024B95C39|nr:mannan endo-1,4-beta-mannosidase 6-like isoform X3 [Syzygium oleosum]
MAPEAGENVSSSADSFFSHPTIKECYKAYIKAVVARKNSMTGVHYFDEPAIFAWELMNEPRSVSESSAPLLQDPGGRFGPKSEISFALGGCSHT